MGVDRKKGITMQMEEGLKKGIGWRKIMKLRVDIPRGGLALQDFILVLLLGDIIVITTNILIGKVRGGSFHRNSRKISLLVLMLS